MHLSCTVFEWSILSHLLVKERSTLTNLLEIRESWTRILQEGLDLDVTYLDYKESFRYGLTPEVANEIARSGFGKQHVKMDGAFSGR